MAIAQEWVNSSQPSLDQKFIRHGREQLTLALNESVAEFRRLRKRFIASVQKDNPAVFGLYSHLLNDARLKRDLLAEIDGGAVAEWVVKLVIECFSEQFAMLSDSYLRALGQRLLLHLNNSACNVVQWPSVSCWWPTS